jgi:diacylglycerol kinase (ATP)
MNTPQHINLQKSRTGLSRLWHAFLYSLSGLRAAWDETAFRQEALLSFVLIPAAFFVGRTWVEVVLLVGSILLLMIVELLNTGLESAIDRIGPEWHDLSKRAKDLGSAAVLLCTLICFGTWGSALYIFFNL